MSVKTADDESYQKSGSANEKAPSFLDQSPPYAAQFPRQLPCSYANFSDNSPTLSTITFVSNLFSIINYGKQR